jgi:hypothetical protein
MIHLNRYSTGPWEYDFSSVDASFLEYPQIEFINCEIKFKEY